MAYNHRVCANLSLLLPSLIAAVCLRPYQMSKRGPARTQPRQRPQGGAVTSANPHIAPLLLSSAVHVDSNATLLLQAIGRNGAGGCAAACCAPDRRPHGLQGEAWPWAPACQRVAGAVPLQSMHVTAGTRSCKTTKTDVTNLYAWFWQTVRLKVIGH